MLEPHREAKLLAAAINATIKVLGRSENGSFRLSNVRCCDLIEAASRGLPFNQLGAVGIEIYGTNGTREAVSAWAYMPREFVVCLEEDPLLTEIFELRAEDCVKSIRALLN